MSKYFRQIPDFDYVSRLPQSKISDYVKVKNLFKKGKLRDDIFQDVTVFTKYEIKGDDRPDNVAYEVYDNADLDWVILLSNNIVNIQTEWPLPQNDFDRVLLEKYKTYENLYSSIHHYETTEVTNSQGVVIVPAGLHVASTYTTTYFDYYQDSLVEVKDAIKPVTNYEWEEEKENKKRNIFILKNRYLGILLDDMQDIMPYKNGSTQYVSETIKRGENIRLY
tara:strand:+ start:4004 stop:4669 length:666 start_codon:yes stop_codon:yes gene_type:complete